SAGAAVSRRAGVLDAHVGGHRRRGGGTDRGRRVPGAAGGGPPRGEKRAGRAPAALAAGGGGGAGRAGPGGSVIAYVGYLQRAAGLPLDPRRLYAEDTLYWVIWYIGLPAVLLGVFGLALMARRGVR